MANPTLPMTVSAWNALPGKQMDLSDVAVLPDGGSSYRRAGAVLADLSVNVKAFGATGDGVTDDSAAIQAALTAGAGQVVFFPKGTYLILTALTTADAAGTVLMGCGIASVIKKGANIDMLTLGSLGQVVSLCLDGNGVNFSGRGIVIATGALDNVSWRRITDCDLLNMRSYCVEFSAAIAGYSSTLLNTRMTLAGANQYTTYCVKLPAAETNGNRVMLGCWTFGHRIADLAGCNNHQMIACQGAVPLMSATCQKVIMIGCRWVNVGDATLALWTIDGTAIAMEGCVIAMTPITFAATLAGCAIGRNSYADVTVLVDSAVTGGSNGNQLELPSRTYVPAWTGGAPAIGNGALNGAYVRDGETCRVNIQLTMGGTTTYGAGAWSFGLPYTAQRNCSGAVYIEDNSGLSVYVGTCYVIAGSNTVRVVTAASIAAYLGSATPFAWAVNDKVYIDLAFTIQ